MNVQFKTAQRQYDMSEAESNLRVELAAAFRVAHHCRLRLAERLDPSFAL